MNVYEKLNRARDLFHQSEIKKSGHNKFAGYHYFELADFVVPALKIFNEVGLTSIIRFDVDIATMQIINNEKPDECIYITSPMSEAALKGCHPVQNLGAVETYIRRYLWVAALEIVEHDSLDSSEPLKEEKKEAPKSKTKHETQEAKIIDPAHAAFVEAMIEWGNSATSLSELTDLWKDNQKMIDAAKTGDKDSYKRLQDHYTKLKQNFKED